MDLLNRLTDHRIIEMDKEIESIMDKIGLILERYNEIDLHGNLNEVPLVISLKTKKNGEVYCEVKSYGIENGEPNFLPILQRILENVEVNRKRMVTDMGYRVSLVIPHLDGRLKELHEFLSNVEIINIC